MRKLAPLAPACTVLLLAFAQLALAQHGDIIVGGSILESLTQRSDIFTFQPLQEKIGLYPSLGADYFIPKYPIGINVELSWRYHLGDYYGYETYRPIFTDVNAMYQAKITKRITLDLMGGIGMASNRFHLLAPCDISGCVNFTSSNHFMEDLAAGVRYRFFRHFFVRPEGHYYHIHSNQGFNSDNVFRVGASVGYQIGK